MAATDPWACPRCAGNRFVELVQVTATCTVAATDPARNPNKIQCISCHTVYASTPDWNWVPQPVIVPVFARSRKACWPWSHEWTKWELVKSGELNRTGDRSDEVIGFVQVQERTCQFCGKLQSRSIKTRVA